MTSQASPESVRHDMSPLVAPPARYASSVSAVPSPSIDLDAVLGDVLRGLRLGAGLTCEEAGRRSGLGPSRVAGLEEGDGLLMFTDAIPLVAAFGSNLLALARLIEHATGQPTVVDAEPGCRS